MPIWIEVKASAGMRIASDLLTSPNSAARKAASTPSSMPQYIDPGIPPTTSATPGTQAKATAKSRSAKGCRRQSGSTTDRKTGAKAMQVAATEALAALIEP